MIRYFQIDRKIASQLSPVLMAIRPIPKLKSYRSGGNGMPTRCPMARIPVPMPRSETTHDQCGTGSFFIDFDRGQGFNVPVAQRPLTKGVPSAPGDTAVTDDSEKSRSRSIGDRPSKTRGRRR
jgi:hypothetical protein